MAATTEDVTMKPAEEEAKETPAASAATSAAETTGMEGEKTTGAPETKETPKEPEKPKYDEKEMDNKEEKGNRPVLRTPVCLNSLDTTLNCVVDIDGVTVSPVAVDGFHLLVAQARANYGVKKGRFLFEAQILEASGRPEVKIGVSTASATWVGGVGSIAFDHCLNLYSNDDGPKELESLDPATCVMSRKDQVFGILLNLVPKSPNKNTISLFLDGKRVTEPQPIPADLCKEPLFPHVSVKGCSVGMNFLSQWKPLDFSVYMIGQAVSADLEKTKVVACQSAPKMVIPVGLNTNEYVKELAKTDCYFILNRAYLEEWVKQSNITMKGNGVYGIVCLDNIKYVAPWIRSRPRNIIWSPGEVLFAEERKKQLDLFPNFEKSAHIHGMSPIKVGRSYYHYQDATLPTEEEGFNSISFITPKEEAEKALAGWKLHQRLRSKVENLRVGSSFAERQEVWKNYQSVTKDTEEGKLFTEEDWMLATLRAEVVCLLHSFKEDVNDESQTSFPLALLDHYYKEYKGMCLNPLTYGCVTLEEILKDHLKDCIFVDDKEMLATKLEKDWENEAIFKLTNGARDTREIWEGVGKEDARLKFAAGKPMRNPNEPQYQQHQDGYRYQRQQGGFQQQHHYQHQQQQQGNYQQQQQGNYQQQQQYGYNQQQQSRQQGQGGYQQGQGGYQQGQGGYQQRQGSYQQGQGQGGYQSSHQGNRHGDNNYSRGGQDQGSSYQRGGGGYQGGFQRQGYGGGKGGSGNKRGVFDTHNVPYAQRMRTN